MQFAGCLLFALGFEFGEFAEQRLCFHLAPGLFITGREVVEGPRDRFICQRIRNGNVGKTPAKVLEEG